MIQHKERDDFYIAMGFRLKQIRQMRKISQENLAAMMRTVRQTIQKYESGEIKMQPDFIQQCADIFNIPIGYFYGEGNKQKYSRASLLIAAEAMMLPNDEVRKNIFTLIKSINHIKEQDNH
jgi:transcriptional regulator with XRE-family HTH domain